MSERVINIMLGMGCIRQCLPALQGYDFIPCVMKSLKNYLLRTHYV